MTKQKMPASTKERNEIELERTPEDEESLKDTVRQRRKEDLRGKIEIQKYIENQSDFDSYFGQLYLYLQSRKICSKGCQGKIFACPKQTKGDQVSLSFNKTTKKLAVVHVPCELMQKERETFDRIDPCYLSSKSITLSSLQSFRNDREKLSKRQDTAGAISLFRHKLANIDKINEVQKGFVLSSSLASKIPSDLLRAFAYMGAKMGYSCAYLNRKDFLESYCSNNGYEVEYREDDLRKAKAASVLYIEDYDKVPGYLDKKKLSDVLSSLFAGRDQPHKLTLRSTDGQSVLKKTDYLLKDSVSLEATKNHIKNILVPYEIKDLDIR